MSESYREKFLKDNDAINYDEGIYAHGSKSDLLWRIESTILEEIVGEMRRTHVRVDYLDFACGTGRIISFLEDKVDSATGIDLSQAMLNRAARKVHGATLLCRDITVDGVEAEGRYDLVTCFRFLKNAEPDLRRAALRQLAMRLKGTDSLLLVTVNGGNRFRYRPWLVPYRRMRAVLTGRKLESHLTNQQARAIINEAGLFVKRAIGMGFIGTRLLKFLPWSLALRIERQLVGVPLLQAFGANQLFVCRLPRDAKATQNNETNIT